jgi:NADH:flavin oxidoreductases, Old Yellow Enzyme family
MNLLQQTLINGRTYKNKMVMAAMTRARADRQGLVNELTEIYYAQRASAGMIITEGINISEAAIGSPFTPGLFTKDQIQAWKKVTDAVHAKGSFIIAQLWHTGRVGHSIDRNGDLPYAPSPIAIKSMKHFTSQGLRDYETPKELTLDEIKQTIKDYGKAARNAMTAGFDGVELHAANGYLPNQFLAESANQRTDTYGGSIENNCRFLLEVMTELISTIGGDKVGIKISPLNPYADIELKDPVATYSYLIRELNKMDLFFLEYMRKGVSFPLLPHYPNGDEVEIFCKHCKHLLVANCGYTRNTAEEELKKGIAKMISFATLYLANPDLPQRFEINGPLNVIDRSTMFGGDAHGYIDYPFLQLEQIYDK